MLSEMMVDYSMSWKLEAGVNDHCILTTEYYLLMADG